MWFAAVIGALVALFAFGIRLRLPLSGLPRWLARFAIAGGACVAVLFANMALYRHDAHLDLTREEAFTPSLEAEQVVRDLHEPLELTYFYKKNDQSALAAMTTLRLLARLNPQLRLETVDTDQNPARANQLGVRVYNTAILRTSTRRVEVVSSDDHEIALGMLRAMRERDVVICFGTGHGEYQIDNFEHQTHFEGLGGRGERLVVQMEDHGLGRLRRSLDKLGLLSRKVDLSAGRPVPDDCAVLVEVNPRSRFSPPETGLLRTYLARGGSFFLAIEPDYTVDESLRALMADAGVNFGDGYLVDPNGHYFTDDQMIAVSKYAPHPITQGLAMSIYPGARPVAAVQPAGGGGPVDAKVLFASTDSSYIVTEKGASKGDGEGEAKGPEPLAVVAEGKLEPSQDKPFRLVAFGNAGFASNSFYPYLSNADMIINCLSWLSREEKAPVARPVVEDVPRVILTGRQAQGIFISTVLVLPGAVALLGGLVWWRRRS
ncbi:MAG: Gldg family protein [Xanthobacteraceae bacterium]|nr:Gldg family protein [Xanthobacteraceae bacterium]